MNSLLDPATGHFRQFRQRFAAQFGEQDGLVLFQAMPFTGLRLRRGPVYFISPAERDRFIAEFNRDGLAVMNRMLRDILLAVVSFMVTTQAVSVLFGNGAGLFEAILFYGHVGTIVWIEQGRLSNLWDAPTKALALRAPAPGEFSQPRQLFRPMAELHNRELFAGALTGPICGFAGVSWWNMPKEPGTQGLLQAGAAVVCIGVILFSARCILEAGARIIGWARA
ncbi:MAG: hypothetical protein ACKOPG_02335 [Novosphingobium sp.]